MPKNSKDFPERVHIAAPQGTHVQLVAIGYHIGRRGDTSAPARNFIADGIRRYIEGLSPKDRRDYEEILEGVKLREQYKLNQKSPAE